MTIITKTINEDSGPNLLGQFEFIGYSIAYATIEAEPGHGDAYVTVQVDGGRESTAHLNEVSGSGRNVIMRLYFLPATNFNGHAGDVIVNYHGGTFTATHVDDYDLTISPVPDPPSSLGLSTTSVREHQLGAFVGQLSASDPDGDTAFTYAIVSDPSSAFVLNGEDLRLRPDVSADYAVQSHYSVGIRVTDPQGLSLSKTFDISVTDVNDAPYGLDDTNSAGNLVASRPSGGAGVGLTARAHDPDGDGTISYAFTDSASGRFAIDRSSGVVSLVDRNQLLPSTAYTVTVRASDGVLFTDKAFTIATAADYLASAGRDIALNLPDHLQEGVAFDVIASFQSVEQLNALVAIAYVAGGSATNGQDFVLNEGIRQVAAHQSPAHDYPVVIDHGTVPNDGLIEDTETAVFSLSAPGHIFSNGASTVTLILPVYDAGVIAGTAANDRLSGTTGADRISAGAGSDQVHGGDGADVLHGEDGDDVLSGDGGADRLFGDDGADTFVYAALSESAPGSSDTIADFHRGVDRLDLAAVAGNGVNLVHDAAGGTGVYFAFTASGEAQGSIYAIGDVEFPDLIIAPTTTLLINGSDNGEVLIAGGGNDTLLGAGGSDQIYGAGGQDKLAGGAGDDYLDGGDDRDLLYGEAGNDTLAGQRGNDYLEGGDGNDQLYGGDGADYQVGNGGEDRLAGGAGDDYLDGGDARDLLYGEDGADFVYAGLGADYLEGGVGDDQLYGGEGADYQVGGAGSDKLAGFSGDDVLLGSEGGDFLYGEDGADWLEGGNGVDYLEGGAGADLYRETSIADSTNGGPDFIGGFERFIDILDISGAAGPFVDIEYLNNGLRAVYYAISNGVASGEVVLTGEIGAGDIRADAGTQFFLNSGETGDTLIGGTRNDIIRAGGGADYIIGRGGADTLTGGSGADTFAYEQASDSTAAAPDTIADFQHGTDKILLTYASGSFVNIVHNGAGYSFLYYAFQGGAAQASINVAGDVEASDLILASGVQVLTTGAFAGPEPADAIVEPHFGHAGSTFGHVYLA